MTGQSRVAASPAGDMPAQLPGALSFDLGGGDGQGPRRIALYVPPGTVPAAGWPVLYLLDGNAVTATAIDIERVQAAYPDVTGITSRFAIVGIGYPVAEAYDEVRRCRDYTPPPGRTYPPFTEGGPAIRTGGAEEFLRFITDDLKPAIEQRCRIDRSRQALFGHSFGGLFVLYALAHAPTSFSHWIAASPSIYWEDRAVLRSIERLETTRVARGRVLVLAGAYEEQLAPFHRRFDDVERRRSALQSARIVELARTTADRLGRIPGLTSQFRIIPGRTHMSVLPDAVNDAVDFFMQP
ncbi:esterase [Methylobacterium indicum]|nr:esterase [Methylobacterium indicum]KTS40802.1 esterase [Methylobacterium indicum]KTS53407.1 esterase [Methylobacterium indicum]